MWKIFPGDLNNKSFFSFLKIGAENRCVSRRMPGFPDWWVLSCFWAQQLGGFPAFFSYCPEVRILHSPTEWPLSFCDSSVHTSAREGSTSKAWGAEEDWAAQRGSESHRQPITKDGGLPDSEDLSFGVSGLVPNSYIKATVSKCRNAELGKHRLGKYQRTERIWILGGPLSLLSRGPSTDIARVGLVQWFLTCASRPLRQTSSPKNIYITIHSSCKMTVMEKLHNSFLECIKESQH